mgnify:CR=1 FL=1
MHELTVHLDDSTFRVFAVAAERAKVPVEDWVKNQLAEVARMKDGLFPVSRGWPEGYEKLFGSIDDETFVEPPDPVGSDNREVRFD